MSRASVGATLAASVVLAHQGQHKRCASRSAIEAAFIMSVWEARSGLSSGSGQYLKPVRVRHHRGPLSTLVLVRVLPACDIFGSQHVPSACIARVQVMLSAA